MIGDRGHNSADGGNPIQRKKAYKVESNETNKNTAVNWPVSEVGENKVSRNGTIEMIDITIKLVAKLIHVKFMPAWNGAKNAGCISVLNSQADSLRKICSISVARSGNQPQCNVSQERERKRENLDSTIPGSSGADM
ncbi:jg19696 [Pararge aegeria aegeria]|uniref:Jg19696 protein n=1 Tax=Pararge aegeria aegeria TaxID=348720 RepID=A0A8S4R2W4_9NEOP|nr:jg19696 [Pararge aegeria aegeria]